MLRIRSLGELRCAALPLKLNLPQAQRLASHAKSLEARGRPLRLGIVHTYTSELLDPWLELEAALAGLQLETYHAAYGVTLQEAREKSQLVAYAPDLTLLLLRTEDLPS